MSDGATYGRPVTTLLVPSDPLHPRRADPHFASERDAARELGWETALVDHDAVEAQRVDEAVRGLAPATAAVYRGWMLSAQSYAAFAASCAAAGVHLRTSAAAYRAAHELPGWVELLAPWTAETAWGTGGLESLDDLAGRLGQGPAVLRDHVKSAKHYWAEAVFVPDVADRDGLRRVAERFLEIRDDAFTGGLVLRRFEHYLSAEVRTWWVDGTCRLVTSHPDTPDAAPGDVHLPTGLAQAVARHPSAFCTVDLALRDDGVWRVVELGDGQVSDRPSSLAPEVLLGQLEHVL